MCDLLGCLPLSGKLRPFAPLGVKSTKKKTQEVASPITRGSELAASDVACPGANFFFPR